MKKQTTPADFTPALRFAVFSDAHIKEPGDDSCEKLSKFIRTAYSVSENGGSYTGLDALISDGDTVNSAEDRQFDAFFAVLNASLRPGTRFLAVTAKYHDCDRPRAQWGKLNAPTGQSADFHTVINGFHFIGISVCPDPEVFHYSDAQKAWLDAEIAEAVRDTPTLPVFVFQHEHVRDTVYGSTLFDGWGEIYFSDIFKKYPNIVNISGHSHYPATDPRSVWQGDFTALNDGGLSYYEFTFDGERKYHPDNASDMAQGLIIEADRKGALRVRVYDLNEDACAAEYYIENAADPSTFAYRPANRAAAAGAPYFDEDASITVTGTEDGAVLTAPPAHTGKDDCVFLYRLSVKNADGNEVHIDKCLADYYYRTFPGEIRFPLTLPAGRYTARITAQSVWDKQSEPLEKIIVI